MHILLIFWRSSLQFIIWLQVYVERIKRIWASVIKYLTSLSLQLPFRSPDGSDIPTRIARRRRGKSHAHPSRASRWPSWRSASTSKSIWHPRSERHWPADWRWPMPRWRRGSRTDAPSGGECPDFQFSLSQRIPLG